MPARYLEKVLSRLRSRKSSRGRTVRRQLLLEGLEGRALMAAVVMPGMEMDHATPPAQVGTPHPGHGGHAVPGETAGHNAAMSLVSAETASHSAIRSGAWSDATIWRDGVLPSDLSQVHIPEGVTVTVDGQVEATIYALRIDGTLRFDSTVDTELRVDTVVGSPSSTFEMGTPESPIDVGVTARLLVADTGPVDRDWDPRFLSRGLVLHGKVVIHGAEKNSWSTAEVAPRAGDDTLVLSELPTGWKVGDQLVIAGTRSDATGDEVAYIQAIDGDQVTLDQPLQVDHVPPASDLRVHIANVTRNAVIQSENVANDRRGHVMFMHTRDVAVANAGFYELGRSNKTLVVDDPQLDSAGTLVPGTGTNPRGRYSVHFHVNGTKKDSPASTVRGSAVVGSPGWGYVNHSSYVDFVDNVSYDVDGAAFNTEVGDEVGSFVNNLSIKTHGTGGEPFEDRENQDFGRAGDGFWFHGTGIAVEGNVATGATGSGIIFWGETLIQGGVDDEGNPAPDAYVAEYLVENLPDPSLIQGHTTIPTLYVPFYRVTDNTAYGSRKGFEVYHHRDGDLSEELSERFGIVDSNVDVNPLGLPDGQIDGITVWNSRTGVKLNYTEDTQISNVRVVSDFAEPGEIGFDAGTNLYNGGNHTYRNLSIEGYETGLLAPRGETVVVEGGTFANGADISIPEPRQTHRRMRIGGDIQFKSLTEQAPDELVQGRQNVVMEADLRNQVDGNVTWFLLSDRVILDFGDFDGQQLFYAAQLPDRVLFSEQPEEVIPDDPGFDIPEQFLGLTNAELQARYMTSFGGMLPSAGAIDVEADGVVGLLGTPTGDPELPPKPLDVDVAIVPVPGFNEDDDVDEPDDDLEDDGDVVDDEDDDDQVPGDEDEVDEDEPADDDEADEDEDLEDDEDVDEEEGDEDDEDEQEVEDEPGEDDEELDEPEDPDDDVADDHDDEDDGEIDEGDDVDECHDREEEEQDEDPEPDEDDGDEGEEEEDPDEDEGGEQEVDDVEADPEEADLDDEEPEEQEEEEHGACQEDDEDVDELEEDDTDEVEGGEAAGNDDEFPGDGIPEDEVADEEDADADEAEDDDGPGDVDDERFHNRDLPTDVNADGATGPLDALAVINHLNEHGPGLLRLVVELLNYFLDVNQDGQASANDVLRVINALNVEAGAGEGAEVQYVPAESGGNATRLPDSGSSHASTIGEADWHPLGGEFAGVPSATTPKAAASQHEHFGDEDYGTLLEEDLLSVLAPDHAAAGL